MRLCIKPKLLGSRFKAGHTMTILLSVFPDPGGCVTIKKNRHSRRVRQRRTRSGIQEKVIKSIWYWIPACVSLRSTCRDDELWHSLANGDPESACGTELTTFSDFQFRGNDWKRKVKWRAISCKPSAAVAYRLWLKAAAWHPSGILEFYDKV